MRSRRGFTLVELMMVVALISILATIAVNYFTGMIMRAKRTEAVVGLGHLWRAQLGYHYRTGQFAGTFSELDFGIVGGRQLSATSYRGRRYTYELSQPWGANSFYCIATAQLDTDPWPDVLEVFDEGR